MWNLSGDDIQRAKQELTGRRAAIKARYDEEIRQLDMKIDEIEAFERAAVAFVSNYKAEEEAAIPTPAGSMADAADAPADEAEDEAFEAETVEAAVASEAERGRQEGRSSRWRMRLATSETTAQ